jgi:hypothetical protein
LVVWKQLSSQQIEPNQHQQFQPNKLQEDPREHQC